MRRTRSAGSGVRATPPTADAIWDVVGDFADISRINPPEVAASMEVFMGDRNFTPALDLVAVRLHVA